MLQRVDYDAGGYVSSLLPGSKNVTDNIPRLSADEVFYEGKVGDKDKQHILSLEQKHVLWLMDVVSKFSQTGSIFMDPFGGSFAIAKAFMSAPMHRLCI